MVLRKEDQTLRKKDGGFWWFILEALCNASYIGKENYGKLYKKNIYSISFQSEPKKGGVS